MFILSITEQNAQHICLLKNCEYNIVCLQVTIKYKHISDTRWWQQNNKIIILCSMITTYHYNFCYLWCPECNRNYMYSKNFHQCCYKLDDSRQAEACTRSHLCKTRSKSEYMYSIYILNLNTTLLYTYISL